ncbi:hypothetical protein [Paucisalibacillus globulus]|uniref:hypothetical protein n=1 Tax=Paucisalibacillus globulus TaxID=351095 RepID=UPI00041892AA|nr:hypothetical protein [Paucisalibacillus globulus]
MKTAEVQAYQPILSEIGRSNSKPEDTPASRNVKTMLPYADISPILAENNVPKIILLLQK